MEQDPASQVSSVWENYRKSSSDQLVTLSGPKAVHALVSQGPIYTLMALGTTAFGFFLGTEEAGQVGVGHPLSSAAAIGLLIAASVLLTVGAVVALFDKISLRRDALARATLTVTGQAQVASAAVQAIATTAAAAAKGIGDSSNRIPAGGGPLT
jgi:hypothetical protein